MRSSMALLLGGLAFALADPVIARANSGIQGESSSAPVTLVIGSDSYTMDGPTGDPVPISTSGDSSGISTTATTTDSTGSMETAASTSPSDGLGARITQAPMLAAGVAGIAYLAL